MTEVRISRETRETRVEVVLNIDGRGRYEIDTGIPFLDHMLSTLALNAAFDLRISARGDLEVDEHHTVEDVAIALGEAIRRATEGRKITRVGSEIYPMDDALAIVALDISGRGYARVDAGFSGARVGGVSTQNLKHFLETLAYRAGITLHVIAYGENDHHISEAIFKALGRALHKATRIDEIREYPSTKGKLD